MTRLQKWQAAIETAASILGDTDPIGISTRDGVIVDIRLVDFRRLFAGKEAKRDPGSHWVHWTIVVEGVEFRSAEKIEAKSETVTV